MDATELRANARKCARAIYAAADAIVAADISALILALVDELDRAIRSENEALASRAWHIENGEKLKAERDAARAEANENVISADAVRVAHQWRMRVWQNAGWSEWCDWREGRKPTGPFVDTCEFEERPLYAVPSFSITDEAVERARKSLQKHGWGYRDTDIRAALEAAASPSGEKAADATDIVDYLRDALTRMGTVGPRGIREMVAQYSKLQSALSAMKRKLEKAVKALEPFAKEAATTEGIDGGEAYSLPSYPDRGLTYFTVDSLRLAREARSDLLKEAGGNPENPANLVAKIPGS